MLSLKSRCKLSGPKLGLGHDGRGVGAVCGHWVDHDLCYSVPDKELSDYVGGCGVVISDPLVTYLAGPVVVEEWRDPCDSFSGLGGGGEGLARGYSRDLVKERTIQIRLVQVCLVMLPSSLQLILTIKSCQGLRSALATVVVVELQSVAMTQSLV